MPLALEFYDARVRKRGGDFARLALSSAISARHYHRCGERIAFGVVHDLVPVGIDRGGRTRGIESGDLSCVERPSDRAEILGELRLVAGAEDDR